VARGCLRCDAINQPRELIFFVHDHREVICG
jgi:hypothetical protein